MEPKGITCIQDKTEYNKNKIVGICKMKNLMDYSI